MIWKHAICTVVASGALWFSLAADAAETKAPELATSKVFDTEVSSLSELDAAPRVSATNLLQADNLKVAFPGNDREVVAEASSMFKDGKLNPGAGVEFKPGMVFLGRFVDNTEYDDSLITRLVLNTSLSAAAAGYGEKGGILAIAGRFPIVDETDWRSNSALRAALLKEQTLNGEKIRKLVKDNVAWNSRQVSFGFGGTLASSDATPQMFQPDATSFWLSWAEPLGEAYQCVLTPRLSHFNDRASRAAIDLAGVGLQAIADRESYRLGANGGLGLLTTGTRFSSLRYQVGASCQLQVEQPKGDSSGKWIEVGADFIWDYAGTTVEGQAGWRFGKEFYKHNVD